ncbi:MAG: hypothetical protein DME12_21770 [Candidatus Rokuibacteriota bacterium]|nr:MAG: hypothetical protein DME12_21770 [Candidatus Rokubacteria bacterium]PYN71284.1 MAG: hypothetical protein DMD93_00585 [Candidatus Rokubacteria bacterium]
MTDSALRTLHDAVMARLDALQAWHRDLHRDAEAGWTEFRTSAVVARELARQGPGVLLMAGLVLDLLGNH